MTRKARRIIFVLSILSFLFFAPSILFYAWGYSFDWENRKPVLTGGIYLKSAPTKAEIYLDFKLLNEKAPALVDRLLPKDYQVKVAKEGYRTWQKRLRVNSGLVTEAKNILLVPTEPKIDIVEENIAVDFDLNDFIGSDNDKAQNYFIKEPSYILYRKTGDQLAGEQISTASLSLQKYEILVSPSDRIAVLGENGDFYLFDAAAKSFDLLSENVIEAQFSDDGRKLLYHTSSELWVWYLDKEQDNKELITRLSQKIKKAVWYGKTNEHIVFVVGDTVKLTELDNRDQRNTFDIATFDGVQDIAYSPRDEKFYLLAGDQLVRMALE